MARPAFWTVPPVLARLGADKQLTGAPMVFTMLGCMAVVPVMLWLLATGGTAPMLYAGVLSAVASVWGAALCAGRVGAAVALALVAVAALAAGAPALWSANALSVSAGLGGGHLLACAFRRRSLVVFCVGFVALDIVIVSGGFVSAALEALPTPGMLGELVSDPPLFNRIEYGGALLGTGDITFAALVAALAHTAGTTRAQTAVVAASYLMASLTLVWLASSLQATVPATPPGLVALTVLGLCVRGRVRAQRSASQA